MDNASRSGIYYSGNVNMSTDGFNAAVDQVSDIKATRQERIDSTIQSFTSDTEVLAWLIDYVQKVQGAEFLFKKQEKEADGFDEDVDPRLSDVLQMLNAHGFKSNSTQNEEFDAAQDNFVEFIVGQAMDRLEQGKLPIVNSIKALAEKNGVQVGDAESEPLMDTQTHG